MGVYWRGGMLLQRIAPPGIHIRMPLIDTYEAIQTTMQVQLICCTFTESACRTQAAKMSGAGRRGGSGGRRGSAVHPDTPAGKASRQALRTSERESCCLSISIFARRLYGKSSMIIKQRQERAKCCANPADTSVLKCV